MTVPVPHAAEVIAIVETPWQGATSVTLDGARAVEVDSTQNRFVFRAVSPGRHVLYTRALGFEPVTDTTYLSDHVGVVVSIRPRQAAICSLAE